jgi:CHASE2 domain-containing sensor protein
MMIINRIGPERLVGYQASVFIAAILAAIGMAALYAYSPRSSIELQAEDALQRLTPHGARPDVVIVGLDDASVARYGPVKSWPRSVLARGLAAVEQDAPKSVVMDLALDKRMRSGDADLWRVIANKQNVELGMAYDAARSMTYTPDDIRSLVFLEKYALAGDLTYDPARMPDFQYPLFEPPVSDFAGSSRGVGVFTRETDDDGVVRTARMTYLSHIRYPTASAPIHGKFPQSNLADGAPVMLPSIALVTPLRIFDMEKENVSFKAGDTLSLLGNVQPPVEIPVDTQGRMNIRYAGPSGTFAHVSFVDVVDGKVDPSVFKDKIVLFGATAPKDAATDAHPTPFRGLMPRVEITANAISTVLSRSYFGRYESRVPGIMIVLGLLTGLTLMFVSGSRTAFAGLALVVGYVVLAGVMSTYGSIMLPVLPGIAVILVTMLVSSILYGGPYKPVELESSPTYIAPPKEAVR